jgi:hypothetical protein
LIDGNRNFALLKLAANPSMLNVAKASLPEVHLQKKFGREKKWKQKVSVNLAPNLS